MRYIEVPARYLVSQRVGENLEKVQGDPEQPIATILRQREPISREFRVCQCQHAMANALQRMALRNDHDQVRKRRGSRAGFHEAVLELSYSSAHRSGGLEWCVA
jgi:hypothetical protein